MKTKLSLCIAAAMVSSQASATDELIIAQNTKIFDRVVVSANQDAQNLDDVDGSVTVINEEDLQRNLADSVKDAFKYVPSVSLGGGRSGDSQINIRGIDGNRVLISIDGVRQAKHLSWGSTFSSRNTVDTNTLKQIEVVPTPGSSLYGSDAMGGIVYFKTKEPSDVYKASEDGIGGNVRIYHDGSNDSLSESVSLAGKKGDLQGLLILTHRDRQETETHGGIGGTGQTRELADPSDGKDKNIFAKLSIDLTDDQQLKLLAEQVNIEDDIIELSSSNTDATYDDHKTRTRFSAEYSVEKETAAFDDFSINVDWQETNTDQYQTYNSSSFGDYSYHGQYDETVRSIDLNFKKALNGSSVNHRIQYGLDVEDIVFEQYRTSNLSGSNRSMPRSEATSFAVFLQDQISFEDSNITLTPGIRYDSSKISPKPDEAYLASSPSDTAPANNENDKVSLKLGATFELNDEWSAFAQFAQGFKAPDMDQMYANYGRFGAYNFISNADLVPETSNSIELGLRVDNAATSLEFVAFYNDYENFIEEVTLAADPSYPYGVFQQQNLSDVVIKGLEVKGEVYLSEFSEALEGFTVQGAIAYAKGEYSDEGDSGPLNSVSPLSGVIGLAYDAPAGKWGSELTLTAVQGKKEKDVNDGDLFLPNGYGVLDLTAYYQINDDLRVDAGIFNMADKEYWEWDTARRYTSSHTGLVRFSEPGRHFRVSLDYQF